MSVAAVTTVTKRYRSRLVTRSAGRYRVTTPYRGVTLVTPPKTMTNEGKEGLRRGFDLVPMPPFKSVGVTGGSTVLLSLPTSEKKSGEKSW